MKSKYLKITKWALSIFTIVGLASCSSEFLEPDPLSEFEPTTTFSTETGIQAALAMTDRHLGRMFINMGNTNTIGMLSDLMFSETTVHAKTDEATMMADWAGNLTPTGWMSTKNGCGGELGWVWNDMWYHVKYANTVLSFIDDVKGLPDSKKNEYKGRALFHRAWGYYNLTFWFGNLPVVTALPTGPKRNYLSTPQSEIIKMLIHDLNNAVDWVPAQKDMTLYGMINKEACRHLLIKCLLADGQFKEAENQANILIDGGDRALMKSTFGTDVKPGESKTWPITRNVIWDLHRPENKVLAANTEYILAFVNVSEQAFQKMPWVRVLGPHFTGNISSPDGSGGAPINRFARTDKKNYNVELDWLRATGRGIGIVRLTDWAQRLLWVYPGQNNDEEDLQDLRHNPSVGNWIRMEDMKYNNKSCSYYGKNLLLYAPEDVIGQDGNYVRKKGQILCTDTIRSWFDYPYYKVYLLDMKAEENLGSNDFQGVSLGGNGNTYIFRLAETYLLRAEAKLYQGNAGGAAQDVNEIRKRANAKYMYSTVNIGDIMNERARELYMEEFRKVELTRVSLILAKTGIPDEWGNVYDINTWDKQAGQDLKGGSYWYQRLVHHSFYNNPNYNNGDITTGKGKEIHYKMDKYNLYWPIPNWAHTGNNEAQLWQNFGYDGYDANCKMHATWQEADEAARN